MEFITSAIDTTINSFDFSFCITVNILTYIIVTSINSYKHTNINIWYKRIILCFSILIVGSVYYISNTDVKLILNSAILSPVFWSWIMKPICKKFKVDYKNIM